MDGIPVESDIVTSAEIMATVADNYERLVQIASRYAVYAAVDAADIVHNALASVIVRADNPDMPPIQRTAPNSGLKYMVRTIVRGGISQMRREKVRHMDSLDEEYSTGELRRQPADNGVPTEELVVGSDVVVQAIAFLAERNPDFADVFYCLVIKDEDAGSYAIRTGENHATVRTRLHRAKRILREAYTSGELASPVSAD